VVLEALQVFTPDRHADFYAALYGACGALTQTLLAALLIRVRATYYRHRFLKRENIMTLPEHGRAFISLVPLSKAAKKKPRR